MEERYQRLRQLPAIDQVLNAPPLRELTGRYPHALLLEAAQDTVNNLRRRLLETPFAEAAALDLSADSVAQQAARLAEADMRPSLCRVINATGTLLHTNLGRAPLGEAALAALDDIARGYSCLEFDLASGQRGHRYSHVEKLLCRLTGAEAATVVNNNAGAVLLTLSALAQGKEAIVSRGELVEIGGAFRIPDVMAAGGVHVREVGTTNKTHLEDYRRAIGEESGLLLKVHTSNYRIVGFTSSVPAEDLVTLGREHDLPVMEDLGSGMLIDLSPFGLPREPTVKETVAAGTDVVTFSGDKLLGGPQAGLIVGKQEAIDKIRRHPMARAMRIDKLTLAALEATLRLYLDPEEAIRRIPLLRMLAVSAEDLKKRARRLSRRIARAIGDRGKPEVVAEDSAVGGGALPLSRLPGFAVALSPSPSLFSAEALAARLRATSPPVIGRIREDRLLLNPRTFGPEEEPHLVRALTQVFKQAGNAP